MGLDERNDLAVEDFERLGGTIKEMGRPFQRFSRLATAWRSMSPRTCTYWSHSGTRLREMAELEWGDVDAACGQLVSLLLDKSPVVPDDVLDPIRHQTPF
jgi:hypothetical protein